MTKAATSKRKLIYHLQAARSTRKVKSVQGAKLVFYHVLSFYLAVAIPSIFVSFSTFFGCPMTHDAPQLQRKIALRNFSSFVSICSLSDGASAGITTNGTGGS